MLLLASSREVLHGHNLYTIMQIKLYRVIHQYIDCVHESLCKSFEGGPSYDNYQPAV